ncbi:hypothetical protein NVP1029O_76 [Vibrio phage 1.029.O._10N.261.55.A7]|nr:hypothetical protein NVP1029O_76 [Vibrio phage 1.029.O._10N.261.55.A7]
MINENGSMPASPLALDIRVDDQGNQFCNDAYEGLTKREMFAMHAMQGLVSRVDFKCDDTSVEGMAIWAKDCADALLKELDNE